MIDINLIPPALRKDGQDANSWTINIRKEIVLGVGGGLIALMLLTHLIVGAIWLVSLSRVSYYNLKWQQVAADKKQLDSINKESGDLKKKIRMVSDITVKKSVPWAPKFNAISDSLPRGLWIRKMTLDKAGLTIEGSVVSKNQNEINNVGIFLSSLKQNENFMKGFSSLEVNSIQRDKDNSVEVTDFTVMAKLIDVPVVGKK